MTRGGRRPGSGQPPKYGAPMTERIGLTMTEAERAEIEAAVPDRCPVGRWIVEAAVMRARGSIRVADLIRVLYALVDFPNAEVCRHYVAAILLNVLEENGLAITVDLARAVVEADDEAAHVHLEKMATALGITSPPPTPP